MGAATTHRSLETTRLICAVHRSYNICWDYQNSATHGGIDGLAPRLICGRRDRGLVCELVVEACGEQRKKLGASSGRWCNEAQNVLKFGPMASLYNVCSETGLS